MAVNFFTTKDFHNLLKNRPEVLYLYYQNRKKFFKWHEFLLYDVIMHILSHTMEVYNSHGSNWSPLRILRLTKLICWQYSCKNNILLHKILQHFFCIFWTNKFYSLTTTLEQVDTPNHGPLSKNNPEITNYSKSKIPGRMM